WTWPSSSCLTRLTKAILSASAIDCGTQFPGTGRLYATNPPLAVVRSPTAPSVPQPTRPGEPGPAPTTGRPEPTASTATPAPTRPTLLGWPVNHLVGLAFGPCRRPTTDGHPLAPAEFPTVVALEVARDTAGTSAAGPGHPDAHPAHGPRQP